MFHKQRVEVRFFEHFQGVVVGFGFLTSTQIFYQCPGEFCRRVLAEFFRGRYIVRSLPLAAQFLQELQDLPLDGVSNPFNRQYRTDMVDKRNILLYHADDNASSPPERIVLFFYHLSDGYTRRHFFLKFRPTGKVLKLRAHDTLVQQ